MQLRVSVQKSLLIYLALIPFVSAVIAFAVGHSNYGIYLPVWVIHSIIMFAAAWFLGAREVVGREIERKHIAIISLLLIVPWIFITIFAGMGPPPATLAEWMRTATEQQMRYIILIVAGILYTCGFVLLREHLKQRGENFYSLLGLTLLLIKIPLYILDMIYLGAYRIELYRIYVASGTEKRPDWPLPIRELFFSVGMIEVSLTYAATALFAVSLKRAGLIKPISSRIYIIISCIGFVLSVLPGSVPDPLAVASYLASIPAFSFIIPYFFAINLLRRTGNGDPLYRQ